MTDISKDVVARTEGASSGEDGRPGGSGKGASSEDASGSSSDNSSSASGPVAFDSDRSSGSASDSSGSGPDSSGSGADSLSKGSGTLSGANPVIVLEGLTKLYGQVAVVDSLDLVVNAGEIFGFLGPNGAGKTTTLLMLLGLSLPSAGKVSVLGFDPVKDPLKVKSKVGYLAENMGFYGDMSARENLSYVAELNRMADYGDKVDEVLDLVGLASDADRPVSEFSRGMRQRLGFAEVLVKDPKIAFLDEPTLGLDPDGIATMLGMITRLPKERGLTVILSSHLLHLVEKVASRVGILRKGKLLAQGTIADLASATGLEPSLEAVYSHYFHSGEEAA